MADYHLPGEPLPNHGPVLPPNPNVIRIVLSPQILLYMPNDWYIYEYEDFNQAHVQIPALNDLEGAELPVQEEAAQEGNNT